MRTKFTLISLCMAAGTIMAAELPEGMKSLLPAGVKTNISTERKLDKQKNLVVAGSPSKGYYAFFAATDGDHGEELWITDGTPEGTRMVKDINPGRSSSEISYLTRFNDKVVFSAYTDDDGAELWISDGTESGTYMVKDIHFAGDSSPRAFTQLSENLMVFAAKDFDSENYDPAGAQYWLWVTDGTEDGTKLIGECNTKWPGQDYGTWTTAWMRVGRKVFFKAADLENKYGEELWITDGTAEGTHMVKDINTEQNATGTAGSAIDAMVNFYNEKLFFKAWSIESGNEPWASDGTEEGTYEIFNANPTVGDNGVGNGSSVFAQSAIPYNGKVYFRGSNYDTIGEELACTNLEKGDYTMFDINTNEPTNTNHSWPDPGVEFDGVYIFCATDGFDATLGNHGGELWYTDGNSVKLQSDAFPGTECMWMKDPTVCGGSMYWWNEGGPSGSNTCLWRIDNKDQMPVQVTHFNPEHDMVHTLRNLNGTLLFATDDDSKALYSYTYRKPGYDPVSDADVMEPEYRTRAEMSAGLNEVVDNQTLVTLSPNPADNYFKVSGADCLSVSIYSLSGSMVKKVDNVSNNTVDVSNLVSGMYIVSIKTADGVVTAKLNVK